jgi:hypothetical protein
MPSLSSRLNSATLIGLSLLVVIPPVIAGMSLPLAAAEAARNLVVNSDFARTYAGRRSPEPYVRNMPGLDKDSAMPCAWTIQPNRWPKTGTDQIGMVSPLRVDGGSALRVVTRKSESLRLRQYVEVVPEATYTCAVQIKGQGTVTLHPCAHTPATGQDLGSANGQATGNWTELRLRVKIGYHRHIVALIIDVGENADVVLRSVELSASLPAGPLPEALVTTKPSRDEDTLYFEDFDGASCSFDVGKDCQLTAGRFGRGLLVTPTAGGAKARLHFGKLPDVGTIEFWYKPAALPAATYDCNPATSVFNLTTPTAYKQLVFIFSGWETAVRFGFQKEQWDNRDSSATCAGLGNYGWGFWQPGGWHHLAGSWDGQAARLYVDGQLEGIRIQGGVKTEWSCEPKNVERPNGDALELVLPAAGVIDEIRVSKVLRYGPIVPVGAGNAPLVMEEGAGSTQASASGPHLESAEKEMNEARLKNISRVPDVQAAYVLPATSAKAAWHGMAGMKPMKDYFGPGADGVEVDGNQEWDRPNTAYWKPADIEPGKYYLGLWQETQGKQWDWQPTDPRVSEYWPDKLLSCAYLNGYPIRFSTTSDPVQVKPGLWLAELQSGGPIALKPGDELAIRPLGGSAVFLRLALYREAPRRGHGWTGQTFGRTFSCSRPFPQLRLGLQLKIDGPGEAGAKHEAKIKIVNPLPYTARAIVDWKLADYFGKPVVAKSETLAIGPHSVKEIVYPFTADTDARAYQLDAKTRPAEGFQPPARRPVEMIELNDWGKLEFLPNLLGPLEAKMHERMDLRSGNSGSRRWLLLDGGLWERAPLAGRRVPAAVPGELKFAPVNVPNGDWWPPKGQYGSWYRKRFKVPEWLRGEALGLEIGKAYREATVFLNGKRLAGVGRGCVPFRPDVTGLVKLDGENELVILVRGDVALSREDYVDRYNPDAWIENDAHRDFPPTNENLACALAGVWLRALPAVRVLQTLVVPDVPKGKLLVLSRVQNVRSTPCTVELRYTVAQQGQTVAAATVPAQTVTLKPGEIAAVKAVGSGQGLRPYTSAEPVLAKLSTSVVEHRAVVDVENTRFGYRSVSVKDGRLTLNGQPITFLGTGPNISPPLEEDGTTIARLPPPLDYIDEVGVFHYPYITNTWPGAEWDLINNDRYWQRDRAGAVEMVWLHGSHPSCVGWDITNECYLYACYSVGGEGQAKYGQRLAATAAEVRRRIWPDFWFLSDGNGNLGHRLNFTSWHYMNQGWSSDYSDGSRVNHEQFHKGLREVAFYAPDSFFVSGAASPPQADAVVHDTHPADDWHPGMACAATEEFWFTDQNNGPAIAKFLGDRAALSSNLQFNTGRGMWWGKLSIEGYRDAGASVMGVYALNFLGLAMQAVSFDMPQQQIRYYSGAAFDRRLTIHDDEFSPGRLEFAWKLLDGNGRKVAGETLRFDSGTSLLKREQVAFKLPDVTERMRCTLDMALRKNGKLREHEQRTVEVWPLDATAGTSALGPVRSRQGDSPIFVPPPTIASRWCPVGARKSVQSPALQVALYDPQGKTQTILEQFGCKVKPLAAISPEALADCRVLIVGPQCVVGNMPSEKDTLQRFAEGGGRVLLLPQTEMGILPGESFLEKRNFSSLGFVRASGHPVMRGLRDMDFAMWNADHLIARGLYRTPNRGNFLPLVECFNLDRQANVIAWTPLWEMYLGKGSILTTQLPLVDKLHAEPMAAEMWRRILEYLGQEVYRKNDGHLAVCAGASEPVLNRLKEIRADFKIVGQMDAASPVTLVEMNQRDFGPSTEAFRQYVEHGGTLILHRVRPEHQEWVAELTGRKVAVEIQPYRSWVDRQWLERRDGLAEGLSNIDFYWRPNVGGEGPDSTCQVSGATAAGKGQVEYVVKVEGAADYLFPGGWVEMRLGKGRIVIDQVKWEVPEKGKNDYGSPMRVVAMLLSNLGIVEKLPVPKPALSRDVKFETLDLAKLANCGFRDERAGDGVGWIDRGPEQDIRDFPTGDTNVGGVPFKVAQGDKNAVVLRVNPAFVKSLADCPESVEIPVARKNIAGLVYLHTGGWANGLKAFGWREVCYADGTKEVTALNNTNFASWNHGHDQFPDEDGTTTNVVWKGACKSYPVTRVYMTTWINPHPAKEIVKVVISNKGLPASERRFLAHLAVTVAIRSELNSSVERARDAKRSQAILQEAIADKQAKQMPAAIAKLQEALKADDRNVGAWITLTEIRAATDDVEPFTSLCNRWFAALPKNYQAHNVLGKFLERKGKLADALAEYKKSLELEWNQPPTIEAKVRLEKLLNQK